MASFITNLFEKGKSHDNLNYGCITVDYFNTPESVKDYMAFLLESGWTAITYTTSTYDTDPYDELAEFGNYNAHNVIGQEFSKVVFVMDHNFTYSPNGKLQAKHSYYSATGMLYQIVTRVVDELKIIILGNQSLYIDLLEIKSLSI